MTEANLTVHQGGASTGRSISRPDPARYRRYDLYYSNPSDLYTKLKHGRELHQMDRRMMADVQLKSALKTVRNPVHRVVEFYATTMLVGTAREAFRLREAEDGVRKAIWKLWAFSNLDVLKQRIKRLVAKHGIVFVKVVSPQDEPIVHYQEIKAEHVSDYSKDARGHIDYIRLDIPIDPALEDEADPVKAMEKKTHTEVWRKGKSKRDSKGNLIKQPGYFKQWTRDRDPVDTSVVAEADLGPPDAEFILSESTEKGSLRFDFVPFVDIVAMDTGDKWPKPVYDHALPLLEEANKMGTRYSELLFLYNKPHRAVVGIGNDSAGRPYPAPEVPGGKDLVSQVDEDFVAFRGQMAALLGNTKPDETLGGDIWFGASGNSDIKDVTPNIEFEAQRRALMDVTEEIKKELPEIIYYETRANAEISARALRIVIASALDRTREMQSNIENGFIKGNKMGLTMAQIKGLDGFSEGEIGKYSPDEGFAHSFEARDIIEASDVEQEEVRGRRIANMIALMQIGFTKEQAAEEVGMTHLKFSENAPEGAGVEDPLDMSVGTGGNPGGGTNLENAASRVARTLNGPASL